MSLRGYSSVEVCSLARLALLLCGCSHSVAYGESRDTVLKEEFDSARRDQIALKGLTLRRERTKLGNANIVFNEGRATINPPAGLVAEITEPSKQAAAFGVERATVTPC
jgi:hypothetical protein